MENTLNRLFGRLDRKFLLIVILLIESVLPGFAEGFFSIDPVTYWNHSPHDNFGVWTFSFDKPNRRWVGAFHPCLEVGVTVGEDTRADQLIAKAYFFDLQNKIIATQLPSKSGTNALPTLPSPMYDTPVLLPKGKITRLAFEVPEKIRSLPWKAVVVFGDKNEAKSSFYPTNENDYFVDYPEKALVYDHTAKNVVRKPAMDPLITDVVKTANPKLPQLTLFLRPPKGITDAKDVKGVLAICILGGSIEDVKRDLTKEEMTGDYAGLFSFANKNKLAILAWASHGTWNASKNYDDLQEANEKAMDKAFDVVADTWEQGVKELCDKYGLPNHDFLLWGVCGSAQSAHRLCMRKPDYFLAIDIHIPGSFDRPRPEASKVLWCLSTGELYGGYERSLRFVKDCRKLGYPMVYKALQGVGHGGNNVSSDLCFAFFDYALTLKDSRDAYDKKMADSFSKPVSPTATPTPWPDSFQHPPYYGDMVNQEMFPAKDANMIPAGFKIPLPTAQIASIWDRTR